MSASYFQPTVVLTGLHSSDTCSIVPATAVTMAMIWARVWAAAPTFSYYISSTSLVHIWTMSRMDVKTPDTRQVHVCTGVQELRRTSIPLRT